MSEKNAFTALIERFDRDGGWSYVSVPEHLCQPFHHLQDRGLIAVTVTAACGDTQMSWDSSLLPMGDGSHFISLPARVRNRLGVELGDEIRVEFAIRYR